MEALFRDELRQLQLAIASLPERNRIAFEITVRRRQVAKSLSTAGISLSMAQVLVDDAMEHCKRELGWNGAETMENLFLIGRRRDRSHDLPVGPVARNAQGLMEAPTEPARHTPSRQANQWWIHCYGRSLTTRSFGVASICGGAPLRMRLGWKSRRLHRLAGHAAEGTGQDWNISGLRRLEHYDSEQECTTEDFESRLKKF